MKVPRVYFDPKIPPSHRHFLEQTGKVLDGNVSFGDTVDNVSLSRNIDCFLSSGTTPAGVNTQFTIAHQLRRVPVGFIVIRLDQAATIYADAIDLAAWSATSFAAKCNVASVAYRIYLV